MVVLQMDARHTVATAGRVICFWSGQPMDPRMNQRSLRKNM